MNCCVPVLASSCVRVQEAKLKKIFLFFLKLVSPLNRAKSGKIWHFQTFEV